MSRDEVVLPGYLLVWADSIALVGKVRHARPTRASSQPVSAPTCVAAHSHAVFLTLSVPAAPSYDRGRFDARHGRRPDMATQPFVGSHGTHNRRDLGIVRHLTAVAYGLTVSIIMVPPSSPPPPTTRRRTD